MRALLFAAAFASAAIAQTAPSTVCDVLVNLQALRGNEIEVRGVVNLTRETFTVGGADFDFKLTTNGITWPRALHLVNGGGAGEETSGIQTDQTSMQILLDQLKKSAPGQVWATIVGRLVARERYTPTNKRADGSLRGNGYRAGARFAAQIVVRTIRNIEVRETPSR